MVNIQMLAVIVHNQIQGHTARLLEMLEMINITQSSMLRLSVMTNSSIILTI